MDSKQENWQIGALTTYGTCIHLFVFLLFYQRFKEISVKSYIFHWIFFYDDLLLYRYLFDNIFFVNGKLNVKIGSGSGWICHKMAVRIRNSGVRIRGSRARLRACLWNRDSLKWDLIGCWKNVDVNWSKVILRWFSVFYLRLTSKFSEIALFWHKGLAKVKKDYGYRSRKIWTQSVE